MTIQETERRKQKAVCDGEQGYLLLGLTVMVFLLLLMMAVAAPAVVKDLERQKELESAYRAREYVRAIQLYFRKTGHYPTSMDQLDETNNIHFLRRHFVDPLTGDEYRLILQGQNQTTVKGFFGEPLQGIATTGIGAGMGGGDASGPGTGTGTGTTGAGSSGGGFSLGGGLSGSPTSPTSPAQGPAGNTGGTGSTGGLGSQDAATFKGGVGPFIGVGTKKTGHAIYAQNGEDDFSKWEFLYDPRVDAMKAKVNILGGGVGSTNAGDLNSPKSSSGTTFNPGSGSGGSTTPK